MTERKTVNGIQTKGLTKTEYMRLYRTRSTEECIHKANDMGKLDTDFYKKIINAMKADPKLKNLIRGFLIVLSIGPMSMFSVDLTLKAILSIYL